MGEKIYLALENSEVYEGTSFGAKPQEDVPGEVVFTTAMTGYAETLTDPSYEGQIVLQTFPTIGNYGISSKDFESGRPYLKAYIVRDWCANPSNFRNEQSVDGFLKRFQIPGISGVDTRTLTKAIRQHGTMNGVLTSNPGTVDFAALRDFSPEEPVPLVSTKKAVRIPAAGARHKVVLWDFGAKNGIADMLAARGCEVVKYPHSAPAKELLRENPDGILLSNGPGDPAVNTGVIDEIRKLGDIGLPMMGICLGHQLMALAFGGKTEKLKFGHRGANQPVRDISTGRAYITSQNHGYAVSRLPDGGRLWFENCNDGTCEGIEYTGWPAFSVQFHPEARGGPQDTGFLFDGFISLMKGGTR